MRTPGVFRKIDSLGRVVIPAQLRQRLELQPGDTLELSLELEGILLKKKADSCVFCGSKEELVNHLTKPVCRNCIACLKDR